MAEKTIEKFLAYAVWLYEQEMEEPFSSRHLAYICDGGQRGCESTTQGGTAPVNQTAVVTLHR